MAIVRVERNRLGFHQDYHKNASHGIHTRWDIFTLFILVRLTHKPFYQINTNLQ